ncbi:dr1-associated corepressor-like [Dendronephthya gigantea]|uniref:dr1-associated corepressor-like n=1 Tax=Dendronephthya gigantea TaxID=151771 RepID=UPI00106925CF|nr:dr1-associated corepressor-like [Dendronephthya gigantea]
MPTKKKYNARFPPARIKKIMQTDEDIGKVAAPVPVILSKALEIFMQSLLETASKSTHARHAKTMSTAHLKQCITSESQFDFLKELVENIPDLPTNEEEAEDLDEPKPKRKKVTSGATSTRKEKGPRKQKIKKNKNVDSDSDEDDYASDEEGSSNSAGSNPPVVPTPTTSRLNTNPTAISNTSTFTKSMIENHALPATPSNFLRPSTSGTALQLPNSSVPASSLFRAAHSEDDDYDS